MTTSFVVEAVRASLGEVYLVGGAVRDSLIGNIDDIKDYDFTTPLDISEVIRRLEENNYKVLKHSLKHGTVTAYVGSTKIEVSTFRREEYEGNSRGDPSTVEFHEVLEEDLRRRDFTINAIAHDGENYIDPYNGRLDIIHQKIRAVGSASQRFEEDPLRMLRALRFVSQLGFRLSPETHDAIVRSGSLIKGVSPQRLTAEFENLLSGKYWQRGVALGFETGLIEAMLDINAEDDFIESFLEHIKSKEPSSDAPLSRWSIFITALIYTWAEINSLRSLRGPVGEVFTNLRDVFVWNKAFENRLYDKVVDLVAEEDYASLERQYEKLSADNDYRQYIVREKMLRIQTKQKVSERRLGEAHTLAKELLEAQTINFRRRLERQENEGELIKEFKSFMLESVKMLYLKFVEDSGYIDTSEKLNLVFAQLMSRKDTFSLLPFSVGDDDKKDAVEGSIMMASRVLSGKITSFSSAELKDENRLIKRNESRLRSIYSSYVRELIALREPPYADDTIEKRGLFNFRAAKVSLELGGSKETLGYYSHMVDYWKWKALTASSLDEFNISYDEMNSALDSIYKNASYRDSYDKATEYLYNAQCLAYAVTLTSDIDLKIEYVRNVIANYKLVPYGKSPRNAQRYQLLFDWLVVARSLIGMQCNESRSILMRLPELKTYRYQDVDEEYIKQKLPEIDRVRTVFYDIEAFLSNLHNVETKLVLRDDGMKSLALLRDMKYIDDALAYEVFKNILRGLISESASLEPVSLLRSTEQVASENLQSENIELMKSGESESVEFKQSWRYDIEQGAVDSTGEVLDSALKTIAAFMNTNGGRLFVGVDDKGVVTGLEVADFLQFRRKATGQLGLQDAFKKLVDDNIGQRIGTAQMTLVSVGFEVYEEKTFCVINVKASPVDIFYKNNFYIRNSASTRALNLKEYSEYRTLRAGA